MISDCLLDAAVRTHAAMRPDSPALIGTAGSSCTYAELAAHLDRLGAVLRGSLPAGNRIVAVAAANGPDLLTAIVAAMSNGICAPFDPYRPAAEIDAFLADITPALVLADDGAIVRHRDAFMRHGVSVLRMSASSASPSGVFDVLSGEPNAGRDHHVKHGEDVALLLRSSGTTASAKIVPHTAQGLMHMFTSIVDMVNLRPEDRCFNARPMHHVHAIAHVIGASLVAGGSIVCPTQIGAATLVEGLRTYKPTWYSAAPPVHRDVLAFLRRTRAPVEHSLRFIRSSSAALDPELAAALEAVLGAPVLQGYGTSEAPSVALNPVPPSANKLGSVGLPLGCEIAIFDGEVAVRGANVAPSYADPGSGWFRTGDAGHIDADGYLFLTGRLNELINIGGEKISPGNVEAALLAHPAVKDAVAFPLPHPTLGQHVAAVVVLRDGAVVTAAGLTAHAASLVPRFAIPHVLELVGQIARDGNGKVRRRELTEAFGRTARALPVDVERAKDNSLLHALSRIWEEVLEYAPISLDENFFAAGGDSLRAVHVMTRIEADLGVTMSLDTLLVAPTIRTLAQAVLAQADRTRPNRIVALRAEGSRPPLLFFDGDLNGGGLYTRFLPAALDVDQPIYIVRPHGALGESIPESIEAMADDDAAMIAAALPSTAYRLAGFCSSGVVAFEVARRLAAAGARIDVVALVGCSAPNARLEPLWRMIAPSARVISPSGATLVYRAARSIANAVRERALPVDLWHGITTLLFHPVAPERLTPAFLIYRDRLMRYFPQRSGQGVDVIWGADDRPRLAGDPSMGWRRVAPARCHAIGGDHTTMLTDHVGELGATFRRILDAADREGR